jgi:hypothetical protein
MMIVSGTKRISSNPPDDFADERPRPFSLVSDQRVQFLGRLEAFCICAVTRLILCVREIGGNETGILHGLMNATMPGNRRS